MLSIGDLICYDNYRNMQIKSENTGCSTAIWASGLVARSSEMDAAASGGGIKTHWPFLHELQNTGTSRVPQIGSTQCDCNGNKMSEMEARKQRRNDCWSWDYLGSMCKSAEDWQTIERIMQLTTTYWTQEYSMVTVATLMGLMEHSIANYTSDQVLQLSMTPNGVLDMEAILMAMESTGCTEMYDGIHVCCSDFFKLASASNSLTPMQIQQTTSSNGQKVLVGNYNGFKVTAGCDEILCAYDGPSHTGKNIGILYRDGDMQYGWGAHPRPQYKEYDECANGGDGAVKYGERAQFVIHPKAWSWVEPGSFASNPNNLSPVNDDLRDPANWSRTCPREESGLTFIVFD